MLFRTQVNPRKVNQLPVGVTRTIRKRTNRPNCRPYVEFQVCYKNDDGVPKIKHFYVGVDPLPVVERLVLAKAIRYREDYEARTLRKAGATRCHACGSLREDPAEPCPGCGTTQTFGGN